MLCFKQLFEKANLINFSVCPPQNPTYVFYLRTV